MTSRERVDAERRVAQLRMPLALDGINAWQRVTDASELTGLLIRLDANDCDRAKRQPSTLADLW